MADPTPPSRRFDPAAAGRLLLLLALGLALARAAALTWLCDDAFISFRYARNLVDGLGLVFNAGEAVEGYTNFLWTLLLAGGMGLGLAPEALSPLLGLGCFAGTALMLAWAGGRAAPSGVLRLPVAALCWLGIHHAQIFATSGLETSLFTLLLLGGAVLAIEARGSAAFAALGLVGALATLTRPEGALVVGLGGLVATVSGPARGRHLAAWAGPTILVLAPWLSWKQAFYGDLLPNTWYAKAGDGPRWAQGALYVGLYLRTWPVVAAGALGALGLVLARRRAGLSPGWGGARPPLVLLALTLPFVVHVLRVGGDFMFARFCLPWTPPLLLAAELALLGLGSARIRLAVGALLATGTALTPPPPELDPVTGEAWKGIVEERAWYPRSWVDEAARQGAVIRQVTAGIPLRVVYYGTQAMLMYYGDVPTAIEGHVGLTDYEIARMPPPDGARVGHGLKATVPYLRSRQVDLAFNFRVVQPLTRMTEVDLGQGVKARLLVYRPAVVDALRARGAVVPDMPAYLDAYIADIDTFDDAKVAEDLAVFRPFYFIPSGDRDRERAFQDRLARGRPPQADPGRPAGP